MTIKHHIPDALLAAYAAGTLPYAYEMVIAAHVSMCDTCRAELAAHQAVGGVVLEETAQAAISVDMKSNLMGMLDAPFELPNAPVRQGIYPGPVAEALKDKDPRWRPLGGGVKQDILNAGPDGSVRLLFIPPGMAVPDHSHNGLELTLVLQGSFSDEAGHFGVGDVEVADQEVDHVPTAGPGLPCICLAATDAPLRFNSWLPRLLQPIFRI